MNLTDLIGQRNYSPRMQAALLRMLDGQSRHEAARLEGVSLSERDKNARSLPRLVKALVELDRRSRGDRG